MRRPLAPLPVPTNGIAALIGGMLGALLYALLGWMQVSRARRGAALEGTLAPVLAAQESITLDLEPIVEWECVPAPWRAGQLLPWRHARAMSLKLPCRFAQAGVAGCGPPASPVMV
ncbi:MAG: hypothetical protein NT133_21200 [Alphaproteobacteria bacterium]|nr:hypothetical protein [Alphaproteobacteria bacterium]